eukprot:7413427-Ditylum_brightwellii.AAC.1
MVVQSNEFTLIEIKKINYYREYLGVTTLADITLADDCTLDPHMRSGNISLFSSTASLLKAKQQHPNYTGWKLWSRCLKLFADHDQLRLPLTQWLQPTPTLKRQWPMYIFPEENSLYVRHNDGYLQYTQSNDNNRVFRDGTKVQWEPINDSFPVNATTVNEANTWMC